MITISIDQPIMRSWSPYWLHDVFAYDVYMDYHDGDRIPADWAVGGIRYRSWMGAGLMEQNYDYTYTS